MINKEHLTPKGLKEIMSIRCSMYKGISPELLRSFTSAMGAIIPAVRPVLSPVELSKISTGWLVGFTDALAGFFVNIRVNRDKPVTDLH